MNDTPSKSVGYCSYSSALIFTVALCWSVPHATPALAQESVETRQKIEQLQQQLIEVQRDSRLKLEALQRETDAQLLLLQQQIAQLNGEGHGVVAAEPVQQAGPETVKGAPDEPVDKLDVFGDFRLRYEANSADGPLPSWDRGVLRARLGARYELGDHFALGARLVTGDPDNPRTSDVTIGDFDSNFEISLDQAYLAFERQDLFLTGGKFAKPFNSTELVWDGDVNLQGAGGSYEVFEDDAWPAQITAIYFLIEQSIFEQGSDMLGGQFSQVFSPGDDWSLSLDLAYYDFDLGALDPAVPGGARGNNLAQDSVTLLSDFNLLDTIGTVTYAGFGERWNVNLVGDYVKNLGAKVPEDSGFEVDLRVGNLDQPGRFLIRYGYAQAETDAVLGMFSNDNIVYATNYELHTFSVDYALQEHTFVGLTNYMYRRLDPIPGFPFDTDWVFRTRLNLYLTF